MAEHDPYAEYEMLEELGSGSFGVVYKALERSTGQLVAVKHIDLDGTDDDIRDIQQEITLLSTCSSPYVTKYKKSFVRGVKLWIVMEYLGGGSCLDLLKVEPFSEAHCAIVCRELLLGLDYLHQSGKIHRDIKAANILLSKSGRVKIADFGVAAQLTNIKSQRKTFVGTPFWMAPEVIQEEGYDFKADIWSLGITAMELVQGEPPNASIHPMKALFHIPKEPSPRLQGPKYSRDLKSFVASCLIKNPDHRPTARDLLQHRFIQRAGRVDTLRELIERRQQQQAIEQEKAHPKYYEETLRDVSAGKEDDSWVFETLKPRAAMSPKHTVKKRKLSTPAATAEVPTEMLGQLSLAEPPPQRPSTPPIYDTVRRIDGQEVCEETARVVLKTPRKVSTPRRPSSHKQPLAVDTNFGNGASTTRQFRRVSDESPTVDPHQPITNENIPPAAQALTREAKIGRKVFSRIVEPVMQELYAQTASKTKQEAIARVDQAWTALDILDPEGEYLMFKLLLDRLQGDQKLSSLLLHASSTPNTPQKPKLMLAQNNPHLQHHHKRQSSQVSLVSAVSEKPSRQSKLPGQPTPGMEHTKHVADVLYGRWVDGMRQRWPQA